jgi:hypothetical protein
MGRPLKADYKITVEFVPEKANFKPLAKMLVEMSWKQWQKEQEELNK